MLRLNRSVNKASIGAPKLVHNPIDDERPIPGFFDASASVVGTPADPRIQAAASGQFNFTMRQYQAFVQAVGAYKRQIQQMSLATESFVAALEGLNEMARNAHANAGAGHSAGGSAVGADGSGGPRGYLDGTDGPLPGTPASQTGSTVTPPPFLSHTARDLELLIDTTHLVSNAHSILAEQFERDFEVPLTKQVMKTLTDVKLRQRENKLVINELATQLQREEEAAHKRAKKKIRDPAALQNSLNVRMSLAADIKHLTLESEHLQDQLAAKSLQFVIASCGGGARALLDMYDRINEGLKKLGAYEAALNDGGSSSSSTGPAKSSASLPSMAQPQPTAHRARLRTPTSGSGGSGVPTPRSSSAVNAQAAAAAAAATTASHPAPAAAPASTRPHVMPTPDSSTGKKAAAAHPSYPPYAAQDPSHGHPHPHHHPAHGAAPPSSFAAPPAGPRAHVPPDPPTLGAMPRLHTRPKGPQPVSPRFAGDGRTSSGTGAASNGTGTGRTSPAADCAPNLSMSSAFDVEGLRRALSTLGAPE